MLVIGDLMKKLIRIFLLPFGLAKKWLDLANEGARDLENKLRFRGAIIDKGSTFSQNTIIHSNVHILENCIINNSQINSFSYVGKNCLVQNTKIGKFCSIANDVSIGLGNHPLDFFSTSPLFYRKQNTFKLQIVDNDLKFEEYQSVIIGNDVWIASRAIILDGVCIGDGSIIASNTVVTKNVEPYSIVGGVPAKVIKYRFNDKKISELKSFKWWDMSLNQIKIHFNI